MNLKSTSTQYGRVAIAIHWASALAVILAFAAGFVVANVAPPAQQGPIVLAHITLGLIVFALTLLRIVWVARRRQGAGTGRRAAALAGADGALGARGILHPAGPDGD